MAGEVELGEARGIVLDVGHEDAARVVEADAHHRVEGARLHPKRVDDGLRDRLSVGAKEYFHQIFSSCCAVCSRPPSTTRSAIVSSQYCKSGPDQCRGR